MMVSEKLFFLKSNESDFLHGVRGWSLLTFQQGGGREMRGDEKNLAAVLGGTKK